MSSGWENFNQNQTENNGVKQGEEKIKKAMITDDDISKWLFKKDVKESPVCAAIYGVDGTGKTGIAMDCRTPEEVKEGYKIFIFDFDGGATPLKSNFFNHDPNIVIINPMIDIEGNLIMIDEDGEANVDYESAVNRTYMAVNFINKNLNKKIVTNEETGEGYILKVKSIVTDGLDKWKKNCEYQLRDELGKNVDEGIDYRYWKRRNQAYFKMVELIKSIPVDKYFITHLRKNMDEKGTWTGEFSPDWIEKTQDMMFQKILTKREEKIEGVEKIVRLKALIEKSKGAPEYEGKEYLIAEVRHTPEGTKSKWFGLRFNGVKIIQNEVK